MNVVLLAMDGSETPRLVSTTLDLLEHFPTAKLVAVYVSRPVQTAHSSHDNEREFAAALERIAKVHYFPQQSKRVRMLHRYGEPWREICSAAAEIDADLVVIGSHRVGVMEHVWPGSVSNAVVHHCVKPVLILKEENH